MSERQYNWTAIAQSPKFIELQRKKTGFLLCLWVFGAVSYYLLPLGAAYTPGLFKTKIFGRINFAYLFCLYQFLSCLGIAMFYAHKANKDFDPISEEVARGIDQGVIG
jgi:uncharacterized membrane protein (DUF485 family)